MDAQQKTNMATGCQFIDLNNLIIYRDAFMLAELGALLHNLGKISSKFIDKSLNGQYKYQHIVGLIEEHCDKKDDSSIPAQFTDELQIICSNLSDSKILRNVTVKALRENKFQLPSPFDDRIYCPAELIEYLGQGWPLYKKINGKLGIEYLFPSGSLLTHLLNKCHAFASGSEKEGIFSPPYQNPGFLATPFGWEKKLFDTPLYLDELREKIETVIQRLLTPPVKPLSHQLLVNELKDYMEQAFADTRRPINDITIWDMGHTAAVMLVTQVVALILKKTQVTHSSVEQSLRTRFLQVRFNGLAFMEAASRLADIRVRKSQIQRALDATCRMLENMPLAFEVYRDENGSIFVFPDLPDSHSIVHQTIACIQTIFSKSGIEPEIALSPSFGLTDKHSWERLVDYFKAEIDSPPEIVCHNPRALKTFWKEWKDKEVCQGCTLRPQGWGANEIEEYKKNPEFYEEKALSRKICCICLKERKGVSEAWATGKLGEKTTWIDEVSDDNGMVALISATLPIGNFIKKIAYPASQPEKFFYRVKFIKASPIENRHLNAQNNPMTWDTERKQLHSAEELKPGFKKTELKIHKPEEIDITIKDIEPYDDNKIKIILEEPLKEDLVDKTVKILGHDFQVKASTTLVSNTIKAANKIYKFCAYHETFPFKVVSPVIKIKDTAQSLSFARLSRTWKCTKNFWSEVMTAWTQNRKDIFPGFRSRLVIKGTFSNEPDLGDYHAYEIDLERDVKLNVVWLPRERAFLSADNLKYVASLLKSKPVSDNEIGTFFKKKFTNRPVNIFEPYGYGGKRKKVGRFQISNIEVSKEYCPVFPILEEPQSFMALVPAKDAIRAVTTIKNKYLTEMAKVRNRMPLHIGVVFAHHRTPVRALLDAGRKFLKLRSVINEDKWEVKEIEPYQDKLSITLKNRMGELKWKVPISMADGKSDYWYPLVWSTGTSQKVLHVTELIPTDEIKFIPSIFDWIWLDSSARRFEIAYTEDGRHAGNPSGPRPYFLEDLKLLEKIWKILKKHLTTNQIYAIRELIETKRSTWQTKNSDNKVFKDFCRSVLANAQWLSIPWQNSEKEEWLDKWSAYAAKGLISDVVELYMQILKERPKEEQGA